MAGGKLRLPRIRKRIFLYVAVAAVFILGCLFIMRKISSDESGSINSGSGPLNWLKTWTNNEQFGKGNQTQMEVIAIPKKHRDTEKNTIELERQNTDMNEAITVDLTSSLSKEVNVHVPPSPNYNVHTFYYAWYGNPKCDGKYMHWNHVYLPHWNPEIDKRYRHGVHKPPDDIGSNFYPKLGPYSSQDPSVIHDHMKQMCAAGVGVIVLSWYPPRKSDDQGEPNDHLVPLILEIAHMYDMKVTLHIEPYKGRSDITLHEDVEFIVNNYSKHKAFYKYVHKDGRQLPLLYIYDSYRTPAADWAMLLKPEGKHTLRNTPYDCVFIALIVESGNRDAIQVGGFDGLYTYFATDGFTYGSSWRFWAHLSAFAKQTDTLFIPSVGPGYIDTNVRPWNSQNTRSRKDGAYYKKSWTAALSVKPEIVSITSFNEWHEGTQIEKAIPKLAPGLIYQDYSPHKPDYYLKLTNEFVEKFRR